MTSTSTRERRSSRPVLIVSCLALATVVAAVASLNVAIPSIAQQTHATQTQLSWIIDAYALVFAALLLPGGAIGDRFGRRRALLVGLTIFGAGSAAAMTVTDPGWLIAMRAVLGVGAALVMPATLATVTSSFAKDDQQRAVGTWAGVAGASAILGLLTSGVLLEMWSWRAVFGLNVVLAVLAIAATRRVIHETVAPAGGRVDVGGALITVAGLGLLVYSVIEAPTEGWRSGRTLLGIGGGLVVLVGFVLWERGHAHPMLDPRLFRNRAFSAAAVTITVQFLAFFGFIFLALQYFQLVRKDSPLMAAVSLLPLPLAMMPCARGIAPRLVKRAGRARICTVGLTLMAAGLLVLGELDPSSSYWLVVAGLVPFGAGMGLAMTPATSTITNALPDSQQGIGSAVNDLARELGGALGIAVLASIMQSAYRSHLRLTGVPSGLVEQIRSSPGVGMHVGGDVASRAAVAFTDGMQLALRCGAAIAFVGAAAIVVLLHGSATEETRGARARSKPVVTR
jgi:EmrB/QacA subfamily drug resistance transporter